MIKLVGGIALSLALGFVFAVGWNMVSVPPQNAPAPAPSVQCAPVDVPLYTNGTDCP
jgi:hypothetical protein